MPDPTTSGPPKSLREARRDGWWNGLVTGILLTSVVIGVLVR